MASKMFSTAVLATLCLVILMVAVEETNAQYWPYNYYYYWGKRQASFGDQKDAPKQFRGLVSPFSDQVQPNFNSDGKNQ
ncbi:hypothetical protein DdX_11809 [Ditylenchus destructor]|uniref:Uncharacterized protein n=1 Tax=Ditylenchus destructor TaxID=166010 RepID=A0AAD4MY39_9BILA|nr:hypothetical protein DdX_11809 [Ditylenchus destructor]